MWFPLKFVAAPFLLKPRLDIGPPGVGIDWLVSRLKTPHVMHLDLTVSESQPPKIMPLHQLPQISNNNTNARRIVLLSDTHGKHECIKVPQADLLVHCGDIIFRQWTGKQAALEKFDAWLGRQPVTEKCIIAGNHDTKVEKNQWTPQNAILLDGSVIQTIQGLRIFGSPYSPPSRRSWNNAFQNQTLGRNHASVLQDLDQEIDVLVTHAKSREFKKVSKKARIWAFGHHHHDYGVTLTDNDSNKCIYINAASCDTMYRPVNPPIVVDVVSCQRK